MRPGENGGLGGLGAVGFENLWVRVDVGSVVCRDSWSICHWCAEGKGPGSEASGRAFLPKKCKVGHSAGRVNGEVRASQIDKVFVLEKPQNLLGFFSF